MCFDERKTESRARSPAARRTFRRTFAVRRSVRSETVAIVRSHHFFLPSLRKMYSPAYLTPLPLYGSGLRKARISAATWPTFCPSLPVTTPSAGFGLVLVDLGLDIGVQHERKRAFGALHLHRLALHHGGDAGGDRHGFFSDTRHSDKSLAIRPGSRFLGLEDRAEDFSAHIVVARIVIGHYALGGGQDRNAEPVVDSRQGLHGGIDPPPR